MAALKRILKMFYKNKFLKRVFMMNLSENNKCIKIQRMMMNIKIKKIPS